MKKHSIILVSLGIIFIVTMSISLIQCINSATAQKSATNKESEDPISDNAKQMLAEGKQTFRFETFGDEAYWTDALQFDKAMAGAPTSHFWKFVSLFLASFSHCSKNFC